MCRKFIWILAAAAAVVAPVAAQTEDRAEPAQVMILGTYHFANPGLDVVKTEVADVLSGEKQAEILAIVESLRRFQPTRITVEYKPDMAVHLDTLYTAYRAGEHELGRNEVEQLGFRLAAMFEHPRVYPIDHGGEFPFGEMMEYAQEHDPAFVEFVGEEIERITEEMNRQQREYSIGKILRLSNDPDKLAQDHGIYMRFARVGAGDSYVGAGLISKWYERNIHIFTNLQRITRPGDRVIVIIGSGHAPILRELVAYDPGMVLVEALEYLPADYGIE